MEKNENKIEHKEKKFNYEFAIQIALVAVLALLIVYDVGKISSIDSTTGGSIATVPGVVSASKIIPQGVPEVYGTELKVKYDDVSANNAQSTEAAIQKLTAYEDMQLDETQMKRYVKIGSSIACEYCCGAQSLVFSNGQRACGCAHSYAMRGLAKYLLTKHPDITDEQILNELGKWKVLFFPGVHEQKAQALTAKGVDPTNYINLASNLYRGAEKGQTQPAGGGMVGGC
ncbi:MAG: hypothetical protein AABW51_01860 [Nanoarchaeota archaeon]